jgi:hypothetical protein
MFSSAMSAGSTSQRPCGPKAKSLFLKNLPVTPFASIFYRDHSRSKRINHNQINNLAKNVFYFSGDTLGPREHDSAVRFRMEERQEGARKHVRDAGFSHRWRSGNAHHGQRANQFAANDRCRGQQELLSLLIRLAEDGMAVIEDVK